MAECVDILDKARLEATGLEYDADNRFLVDPETGEVFSLDQVTDEETAKAATHRIVSNDAVIARLEEHVELLKLEIGRRKRRKDLLKEMYLPGLAIVAASLIKKGQSTLLGYCTVGFKKQRAKTTVVDSKRALEWALTNRPGAVKLTVDLDTLPGAAQNSIARIALAALELEDEIIISGDVRTSKLDESAELPKDAFEVVEGGAMEWYVK